MKSLQEGLIIAAHGRQYLVLTDGKKEVIAYPRGKKSEIACGDRVSLSLQSDNQARIEAILPREHFFYRKDPVREKILAANLTQIVFVVATEPSFSMELLYRVALAARFAKIKLQVLLNKSDLTAQLSAAKAALTPLLALDIPLLELSAQEDVSPLAALLQNEKSLLLGQSGMGKSTLLNALIPNAQARTREISLALDAGKHTTTHSALYFLNERSWLIDSPGLQAFGLTHLPQEAIFAGFPELLSIPPCRFRNCLHDKEPDCAVQAQVAFGAFSKERYTLFAKLSHEARLAERAS